MWTFLDNHDLFLTPKIINNSLTSSTTYPPGSQTVHQGSAAQAQGHQEMF